MSAKKGREVKGGVLKLKWEILGHENTHEGNGPRTEARISLQLQKKKKQKRMGKDEDKFVDLVMGEQSICSLLLFV